MFKKTERVRRMEEEVSVQEDRESEEDGWRGECARRQRERERRMDGEGSVQDKRERGGWRKR